MFLDKNFPNSVHTRFYIYTIYIGKYTNPIDPMSFWNMILSLKSMIFLKGSTARFLHSSQRLVLRQGPFFWRLIVLAWYPMVAYWPLAHGVKHGSLALNKRRCNLPFGSVVMSGSG